MTEFTNELIRVCTAEWNYFEKGKKKETDRPDHYKRVGKYWRSIGKTKLDGRTQVKNKKGKLVRPAWSAAFISYCMGEAGAGGRFKYAEAHCHYIDRAMHDGENKVQGVAYWAIDPADYGPQPGDLICAGREYAVDYDYAVAKLSYKADSFYPSHADIVVNVDGKSGQVSVIGGNVSDSVTLKHYTLDAHGKLLDRMGLDNQEHPWICVMRCVL